MTDISINGRRLSKFNPVVNLDNENIYSQKDLDEEREAVIGRVLEIIERNKYSDRWNIYEEMWNERMDEIAAGVKALKGGE